MPLPRRARRAKCQVLSALPHSEILAVARKCAWRTFRLKRSDRFQSLSQVLHVLRANGEPWSRLHRVKRPVSPIRQTASAYVSAIAGSASICRMPARPGRVRTSPACRGSSFSTPPSPAPSGRATRPPVPAFRPGPPSPSPKGARAEPDSTNHTRHPPAVGAQPS